MEQLLVLKDLAVIFAVSLLVILAFHRVKLPPLPGFIVAGVLLGPNALGLVSDVHRVEGLAEVGVVLLLFTIGIEFSLSRLREMGRQVLVGGGLQVGLTVAAAAGLAAALGHPWRVALFLGCLTALSSTALVLKGLTDQGEVDAPHGRLASGVLIFQDLCVVPIMLALPFLAGRAGGGGAQLALALGKAALIVIGVTILARTVVPPLLTESPRAREWTSGGSSCRSAATPEFVTNVWRAPGLSVRRVTRCGVDATHARAKHPRSHRKYAEKLAFPGII